MAILPVSCSTNEAYLPFAQCNTVNLVNLVEDCHGKRGDGLKRSIMGDPLVHQT